MQIRRYSVSLIIAGLSLILDQWSKGFFAQLLAQEWLRGSNEVRVTDFLSFVLVHNKGISFGMFNQWEYSRYFFTLMAFIISGFLLHWLRSVSSTYAITGTGLIIGGAFGNVVDRIRYGYVIDFLDFHWHQYHWPAFNIADSCIFIGVALLFISTVQDIEKNPERNIENER